MKWKFERVDWHKNGQCWSWLKVRGLMKRPLFDKSAEETTGPAEKPIP